MHFVSGIQSGGVEQMLINYTKCMNEQFDISQIVVYQHNPNEVCLNKFIEAKDKCVRISDKRKHPIKNIIDTFRIIKSEKPDVIHAHMNLLNFIPLLCGFLCNVKVRISHSHIANKNINSTSAEKVFKFLNILFSNSLLACGYNAGKYMYGNKDFTIIYNSIDINRFIYNENKRKKIREKIDLKDDETLLVNVGRLTDQKNQFFLLKVMKKVIYFNDKIKLIIFGNGELKEKLINGIKNNDLQNNVFIHEPVNNIDEYYDASDIFTLPSLYEGFPVSLIEAQVSGLNSIVSKSIDKTSRINNSVEFINNNDEDEWVNEILSLKNRNRNVRIEKFKKFDINNSYKDLYALYTRALNENKTERG